MDRTRSSFMVLHTPVICAQDVLASFTAKVPTVPDAPPVSTLLARLNPARSRAGLDTKRAGTASAQGGDHDASGASQAPTP